MKKGKIRDLLFANMEGCSNHNCIITGPKKGMGTNGTCSCMLNFSRTQLQILSSRIRAIADKEIDKD